MLSLHTVDQNAEASSTRGQTKTGERRIQDQRHPEESKNHPTPETPHACTFHPIIVLKLGMALRAFHCADLWFQNTGTEGAFLNSPSVSYQSTDQTSPDRYPVQFHAYRKGRKPPLSYPVCELMLSYHRRCSGCS